MHPVALSGADLLNTPARQSLISKIKRLVSATDVVWNRHYLYAIQQFAELAQNLPASEIHHHSEQGGLIDHTLEALHAGVRISHGYILPPNAEPENIGPGADRWRFGAFIAILAHDLGKIVTDLEVVYRAPNSTFQQWFPWYGNLPAGVEYQYRFRKKIENSRLAKTLHEKSGMSLLPRLLTPEATKWLFSDMELVSQLFSTVSHSTFGGHVIAEIVRTADGASVSKNLGASTGKKADHSSAVPLHEKLVVSLRKLVADGDLIRNKPGAALWVTEECTWVVSKATIEAVRAQLLNEGHSGIPKSVVTIFGILKDHECIVATPEGDSVWYAEIDDPAKNWRQKLTFLRFKNEVIWPTSQPDLFDGTVTPIDRNGKTLAEGQPRVSEAGESKVAAEGNLESPPSLTCPESGTAPIKSPKISKPDSSREGQRTQSPKETLNPISKRTTTSEDGNAPAEGGLTSRDAADKWKTRRQIQEEVLRQNDFISWLLRGIATKRIRVNEPKAPVHVLENHVALVTPAIFNDFLDKNRLKKQIYERRAGDKRVFTLLQKEIEALDIHQRGMNGKNIVSVSVEGIRSKSELRVYLLNRDCFPSLHNFNANPAIKIHL
jgi:integrating conjugative element relaxase (TIGR03760 family)